MALKQVKALELECTVMAQGGHLVSALGIASRSVCHQRCMVEYLDRCYWNRSSHILSDSQAVIKALSNHCITSELVEHNSIQLIWVVMRTLMGVKQETSGLEHRYERLFIGPQPACSIPWK
jgi:hypothetical protein